MVGCHKVTAVTKRGISFLNILMLSRERGESVRLTSAFILSFQNDFFHRHQRNHAARRFWSHSRGGGDDAADVDDDEELSNMIRRGMHPAADPVALAHHYTNFTTGRRNTACCSLM